MDGLRISLFGKISVLRAGQPLAAPLATKPLELLAYLILHRGQVHTRETLADLLWVDSTGTQSKKYLRQAIWKLRTVMDPQELPDNEHLLIMRGDWIQVNPDLDLWVDAAAFEQAYIITHGVAGAALDSDGAELLRDALALYQGDLLDGTYHDWCIYERERFHSMRLAMLHKLMGYCETSGEYELGIDYGLDILRHDSIREQTHRKLMRLFYLSGDRAGALRQFNQCVAILDAELEVSPSRQTIALYNQIRSDQMVDTPGVLEPLAPEFNRLSFQFDGILSRFDQLEAIFAESQNELQQQIRAIESALNHRQ